MAPNRFTAVTLLLVPALIRVSTSESELEGLTPCFGDDDCNDLKNSTCSGGLCMCHDGRNLTYVCQATSYVVSNKMGGQCEDDRNCNLNNSVCSREKKCVCKEGFVASGDDRKCLKAISRLGDPCEEDIQCSALITYGTCQNRTCTCQSHTHNYHGWCLLNRALGEECFQDEECLTTSSSCTKLRCTCLDGHVAINGKCLRITQDMGDGCEEDIQCTTAFGDGSHCSQGICQCRDLYQFKAINSTCVRDIFLGETCATNSDCSRSGTKSSPLRCLEGNCKCEEGYKEVDGVCTEKDQSRSSAVLASWQYLLIVYMCLSSFLCSIFV